MPIGPQLPALWRYPDSMASVQYCETCMAEIMEELEHNDGLLVSYDKLTTTSMVVNISKL